MTEQSTYLALPEIKIKFQQEHYYQNDQEEEEEAILYVIEDMRYKTSILGIPELGRQLYGASWRNLENNQQRYKVQKIARCEVCHEPLTNHNVTAYERCKEHAMDPTCKMKGCISLKDRNSDMCRQHALKTGEYKICCISHELLPIEAMIEDENGNWYDKEIEPTFHCENCNLPVNTDYSSDYVTIDGTDNFCSDSCARDYGWRTCANGCCSDYMHEDDMCYDEENDEYVCSECYGERQRERRRNRIEERNNSIKIYVEKGSEPTFGFELELYTWPEDDYEEWLPSSWGIHGDGTTGSGYEVTTPPYTLQQMKKYMKETCKYLMENSEVTKKEGTHMHVGNFQDIDHAVRFWQLCVEAEPLWATWLISASRKSNSYCQDTAQFSLEISENATNPRVGNGSRYLKTNIMSYREHETIEIRAHQGTLDFEKMYRWAELFGAIWFHAKEAKDKPRTENLKVWFEDLEISKETRNFYKERTKTMYAEMIDLEKATEAKGKKKFTTISLYYAGERYEDGKEMWDLMYKEGLMKFQQNDYRDDRRLWQMITECRRYDEMGFGTPDLTIWLQEPIKITIPESTKDAARGWIAMGSRPIAGCNCNQCQAMRSVMAETIQIANEVQITENIQEETI